jgi:hypothetical protein
MLVLSLAAVLCCLVPARASADPANPSPPISPTGPDRSGFTVEAGVGIANTRDDLMTTGDGSRIGLAPLSLSLGGFVSRDVAILARMAGTSYFETIGGHQEQLVSAFYGVAVEYWINDRVIVSGGLGLALHGPNPLLTNLKNVEPDRGRGLELRAGYALLTSRANTLRAALSVFPSWFPNGSTLGTALTVEWQHF